jgi:hypothetical protein
VKVSNHASPFESVGNKPQVFNSGVAHIFVARNVAEKGNQPEMVLEKKLDLRFQYKTVGLTRFYTAQQNDIKIDETIAVPQNRTISTHDVVVLTPSDRRYVVEQVQHKDDTAPKTTLLSLSEVDEAYDPARV